MRFSTPCHIGAKSWGQLCKPLTVQSCSPHSVQGPRIRVPSFQAASREVTAPASERTVEDGTSDASQSVEMFVASSALQHVMVADRNGMSTYDAKLASRRMVPSPRTAAVVAPLAPQVAPVDMIVAPSGPNNNSSRALKVELGLTAAELQSKGAKLAQAQLTLRQRDNEIVELKEKLNEKDMHIQQYKAEIRESRVRLQEKDSELRMAYQQLMDAATERAQLRELLILTEQELQQTKSELKNWTDGLFEVKSLIDGIDDDGVLASLDLESAVSSFEATDALDAESAALTEEELDKALDFLKNLSEMSRTLLEDAKHDEIVFDSE